MKLTQNLFWFTLVELLVVITVVMLLFTAGSQLDFNRIWNSQRIEIFNAKILSHYETIRNNALLGKWIATTIDVPDSWKIQYSTAGSWTINSQYTLDNGTSWEIFNEFTPNIPEKHSIENIECFALDGSNAQDSNNTAEIIFNWNNITLGWRCTDSARILQFETHFLDHVQTFRINVLNGTMDIK